MKTSRIEHDMIGSNNLNELLLLQEATQRLLSKTDAVATIRNKELNVLLDKDSLITIVEQLRTKSEFLFKTLVDITAIDYLGEEKRFHIVYHFLSMHNNQRIRLKIAVKDGDEIPSITSLYKSADWYEREVFDMYGIKFSGHQDLRRILTDYGFRGHPLRKDFPLTGYQEVRYDEARKKVVYETVSLQQEFRDLDFSSPWEGVDEYETINNEEKNSK